MLVMYTDAPFVLRNGEHPQTPKVIMEYFIPWERHAMVQASEVSDDVHSEAGRTTYPLKDVAPVPVFVRMKGV